MLYIADRIGVLLVITDLIFERDRFDAAGSFGLGTKLTVHPVALEAILHTRVGAGFGFPFELELEVTERLLREQVPRRAHSGCRAQRSVIRGPCGPGRSRLRT